MQTCAQGLRDAEGGNQRELEEEFRRELQKEVADVGGAKGLELKKVARRDGCRLDYATWLGKVHTMPKERFQRLKSKLLCQPQSS